MVLLLMVIPLGVSAQQPTQPQRSGALGLNLDWTVVSADSNVQTNNVDTAWFSIKAANATHFWRSFQSSRDTFFAAESLHVVMEHSPDYLDGPWVVFDSTAILQLTDSTTTGYYKIIQRVEIDSGYVGHYWRIRARRGKVSPTTTIFDGIRGNIYKERVKFWIESGLGND